MVKSMWTLDHPIPLYFYNSLHSVGAAADAVFGSLRVLVHPKGVQSC